MTIAWTPSELDRRRLVEAGVSVVASGRKPVDGGDPALIQWAKETGRLVYIGRYHPRFGSSVWRNRHELYDTEDDVERSRVCDAYAADLATRVDLLARIGELKGMVLVCWCHPRRCHGDHLAALASRQT